MIVFQKCQKKALSTKEILELKTPRKHKLCVEELSKAEEERRRTFPETTMFLPLFFLSSCFPTLLLSVTPWDKLLAGDQ